MGAVATGLSATAASAMLYRPVEQMPKQQREDGGDGQGDSRAGREAPDIGRELALGGLEVHRVDDAQVVRHADDAGDQADDGQAVLVGVDGGEEQVELADEAGGRRDAAPART